MTTLRKYKRFSGSRGQSEPNVCQHPDDLRIDARSMGHLDRFICGVCGAKLGDWSN